MGMHNPSETRPTTLADGLLRYTPADPSEQGHIERMQRLLESDGNPFSRAHSSPGHFTASAFVLSPEHDALLLIHHGRLDRWLQPGGHFEPGDADLFEAALREAIEETGAEGLRLVHGREIFDVDIHTIPAGRGEPEHEHFDLRVLLDTTSRRIEDSDEVKGAAWVPLDEVGTLESDESVLRAVRKLQSKR